MMDEAAEIPSIQTVVFTGGECFLLRDKLDTLIARATSHGLITRCVTNGYWAVNRKAAMNRAANAAKAGLKEINFSTGTFHSRYVPIPRIVDAAYASVQVGLTTLITAEIFNESDFPIEQIVDHPDLQPLIADGKLLIQRNVWIENGGTTKLTHAPENSRFNSNRISGCSTIMNVVSVTPDMHLVACCGLHLERIPDLHLGSVAHKTIAEVLNETPDDFLKIWIHIAGPERILQFVKQYLPDYELPLHSVHPCETCLHLYTDQRAKDVIREHYHEVETEITEQYLTSLMVNSLNKKFIERAGPSKQLAVLP
jgi:organic radical activating enzyme